MQSQESLEEGGKKANEKEVNPTAASEIQMTWPGTKEF
jgi:hypothetical protein